MKRILPAVLLVLFCTAISFAADSDFNKIDINKDGKISKEEFLAAAVKSFNIIDKNKDGFLTRSELQAIDKNEGAKFIKKGDANKDGKISQEEFTRTAEKRFKFLDKNNDGFIDQEEWNGSKHGVTQKNAKISPVAPFIILNF